MPYVVVVYQAKEFCDLIRKNLLMDHVHKVQSQYPSFTICYATNNLMSYIKKWLGFVLISFFLCCSFNFVLDTDVRSSFCLKFDKKWKKKNLGISIYTLFGRRVE